MVGEFWDRGILGQGEFREPSVLIFIGRPLAALGRGRFKYLFV